MKSDLHPEFLTNEEGERISVVLPIEEFNEILEDLEDLAVIAERRDEETISHQDLLRLLDNDEKYGEYLSDSRRQLSGGSHDLRDDACRRNYPCASS